MKQKNLKCPRCNGNNIENYGEIIECHDCNLEFEKKDIETIKDKSNILSIQEKEEFIDIMKENEENNNKSN